VVLELRRSFARKCYGRINSTEPEAARDNWHNFQVRKAIFFRTINSYISLTHHSTIGSYLNWGTDFYMLAQFFSDDKNDGGNRIYVYCVLLTICINFLVQMLIVFVSKRWNGKKVRATLTHFAIV
jgi:hypothetical protein